MSHFIQEAENVFFSFLSGMGRGGKATGEEKVLQIRHLVHRQTRCAC